MSSNISHPLETLQRIEKEWSSSRMYSYDAPIPIIIKRVEKECRSFLLFIYGYRSSENYCDYDKLQRIEEDWGSFHAFSNEYWSKLSHLRETLGMMEHQCYSFEILLHDYLFPEDSDALDTRQQKKHNFLSSLLQIIEECDSFLIFLEKYLPSDESIHFEALKTIRYECDSFKLLSEEYLSSIDGLKFLKREVKFLDIILNSQILIDKPDVREKVQVLFQDAEADVITFSMQVRSRRPYFPLSILDVQNKFRKTKLKIRAKYSITKISFQILANKDAIVVPNLVMEFIDTVIGNLSDLLKFNDPSSLLCVGGQLMDQIEKSMKELKVLRSFVLFVSCRCIEPRGQQTFFSHALEVAWNMIMITWLYFPSAKYDSPPGEEYPLLFDVLRSKIQPNEPSIGKIYIDVLQTLKSQWYHGIEIIDCEVEFVDTLLHSLKELPISSKFIAIKETLREMLNILRTNLINLPRKELEFHLRDIDSVITDVGLLVYSLIGNKHEKEVTYLGETNQALIQSMKETIYFITRKSFLLRPNLTRIDGLGSTGFILDNLQEFIGCHLDSVSSIKSQLHTIQMEIKCFQKVVEQRDGLQHFATRVMGWTYEVEYIIDACKEEVPDWCLSPWILHTIEDIKLLMKEVEDMQEMEVSDLVLHNTIEAAREHTPQSASNPSSNEEMVGFEDVMAELKGKLIGGSSDLDVISIVGMAGLGKTTLANKLYIDESVVPNFDIRAHCCVSQEYTRKDLLLAILHDITDETAELHGKREDQLADKLRQLLMRKRYLVLIDDVWETNAWGDLMLCFPEDSNGSRIIMATRHDEVASHAKHISDPHKLRFFSIDESRMLLQNKVFNKEICPSDLEDVGERISQKCGGLPFSIVLIAGILKKRKGKHFWEQVATNLGPNIQGQSKSTLDLSYQNLPHHLKPLFLYLLVFTEDREIQVSKLTWLWIAEGFIETHAKKLSEDIAENYLENLIGRNLVMVAKKSSDGKMKACRIHDLVLEFCRKKASSEKFLEKITGDRGSDHPCTPKCNTSRRLSFYSQCDSLEKWCLSFSHMKSFQFRRLEILHSLQ